MRFVHIGNPEQTAARIAPEYGGMLAGLTVRGREILRLDERVLSLAPMLAGGMPFRDAYREAADPARWSSRDPAASLGERVSPGAAGDLRLDALATRWSALGH